MAGQAWGVLDYILYCVLRSDERNGVETPCPWPELWRENPMALGDHPWQSCDGEIPHAGVMTGSQQQQKDLPLWFVSCLSVWLGLVQSGDATWQCQLPALKVSCQEEAGEQHPGGSCVLTSHHSDAWCRTQEGCRGTDLRVTHRDTWAGRRSSYFPDYF